MRRFSAWIVSVASLILIMSVVASPASAAYLGRNGRIAFRRFFDPAEQTRGAIFTMRPNGEGVVQITHRGKVAYDNQPIWSPNGRWIAFYRVEPGKPNRIFKVRPDGTDLTLLSHDPSPDVNDEFPAWSPNGRRIAFGRFDDTTGLEALFVMRADGTHVHQIPNTATYHANFPRYSPNGHRRAFSGHTDRGGATFTIHLDGTHVRRVTPWKLAAGVYDWSPDGQWILGELHGLGGGPQRNVYIVHPNGTDLTRVTNTHTKGAINWGGLSFSPDGTKIVAAHTDVGISPYPDLWLMNLDGSDPVDVTNSATWESAPNWGPRPT
jgi:TolB protein